ncbi:MAG: pyridoxal-phosphate dependent enzyme [Sandaracinaceae bacterium]|nr:pyridoxal-phosphate dependent enzyme [Sandaracinaceae bacterium]
MSTYATDLAAVRAARERIRPHVHVTPVMTSATLDRRSGRRLFFKCENLQKGGAFKARGATNAVLSLDDAQAARGVVTHSSGNHAQALAIAAKIRGVPAHIVMPKDAPRPEARRRRGLRRDGAPLRADPEGAGGDGRAPRPGDGRRARPPTIIRT